MMCFLHGTFEVIFHFEVFLNFCQIPSCFFLRNAFFNPKKFSETHWNWAWKPLTNLHTPLPKVCPQILLYKQNMFSKCLELMFISYLVIGCIAEKGKGVWEAKIC